ncbi:Proteolipid protein DM beta [Nymphon striatum]|nr:Proteolipid protein DM beta [Nymphon striatum]
MICQVRVLIQVFLLVTRRKEYFNHSVMFINGVTQQLWPQSSHSCIERGYYPNTNPYVSPVTSVRKLKNLKELKSVDRRCQTHPLKCVKIPHVVMHTSADRSCSNNEGGCRNLPARNSIFSDSFEEGYKYYVNPETGAMYKIYDENLMACSKTSRCLARVPFGTLIATILCFVGVGVFLFTMWRAISLTLGMFRDLFKVQVLWLDDLQVIFVVVGAVMGGLGLFILIVGCLSTGNTRAYVYKDWKARFGGRISCAILMTIVYILNLAWICILCCMVALTLVCTMLWGLCSNIDYIKTKRCIDLTQFHFLFPSTTKYEDLSICSEGRVKQLCKDYVEQAEVLYILSTAACILVVISLVQYLICLAANYTHIKDDEKLQDFQELQYLQDTELGSMPKERF